MMLSIAAGFASLPEASMRLTSSSRFEAEIVRDAMISLCLHGLLEAPVCDGAALGPRFWKGG